MYCQFCGSDDVQWVYPADAIIAVSITGKVRDLGGGVKVCEPCHDDLQAIYGFSAQIPDEESNRPMTKAVIEDQVRNPDLRHLAEQTHKKMGNILRRSHRHISDEGIRQGVGPCPFDADRWVETFMPNLGGMLMAFDIARKGEPRRFG